MYTGERPKFYVFNEWMVLQKHIRWMKCLNLYQMSAVLFFMLIGVACSMSNLSEAGFASWLWIVGDAVGGCISITLLQSFVVLAGLLCSSRFDVVVIGSGCVSTRWSGASSKLSVDIVVRSSFGASSSVAISMLMPLCLANNFNSSIASRASRFSCKNLLFCIWIYLVFIFGDWWWWSQLIFAHIRAFPTKNEKNLHRKFNMA